MLRLETQALVNYEAVSSRANVFRLFVRRYPCKTGVYHSAQVVSVECVEFKRSFIGDFVRGQAAQRFIDQRPQLIGGSGIA